jgi:hypothetical protein
VVEIRFEHGIGKLCGAKLSHSVDGGATYSRCAIYPGKGNDALLECSSWEWNTAAGWGNVKFNGRPRTVYWNLYLNHLHAHAGPATLRAEILREDGATAYDVALTITPTRAVYLDDWSKWAPADSGWRVEGGRLTIADHGGLEQPVRIRPQLSGEYEVHIGIPSGPLSAMLKMSDEPNRYPFSVSRPYTNRMWEAKEVLWKTVRLRPDSALEIGATPSTIHDRKGSPFGAVSYVKLVPVTRRRRAAPPRWADKRLALYFEPYSVAFQYGLEQRWQVREVLSLFQEMGADEIHTQALRFGSRAMHHSRVAERVAGQTASDSGTYSENPERMVQALDVLREAIDICRELGMTHYANAGLTICYPGTDLEERISREHPEWREGSLLRYCRPETRAYAAAIVREFVQWGTDGVSIDCLRYPEPHTESDLLALFQEIAAAMRQARPDRPTPLAARIPVEDVTYFRAFAELARKGIVTCVIPSSSAEEGPSLTLKPYLRWQDYGCRIYGRVAVWAAGLGGRRTHLSDTGSIHRDITRFFRQGADGIFVYQADRHLADAFTRAAFDWRRW